MMMINKNMNGKQWNCVRRASTSVLSSRRKKRSFISNSNRRNVVKRVENLDLGLELRPRVGLSAGRRGGEGRRPLYERVNSVKCKENCKTVGLIPRNTQSL